MSEVAIKVTNVSKTYRIWESPSARLTSPLLHQLGKLAGKNTFVGKWFISKANNFFRDFYALKDVSFEVKKGQAVGIVGRNGSGKSTLLQIIAGTVKPTNGSVEVNGRVAALLELGAGFNPEFTGKENIYINTSVLGLSKAETDAKYAAIAAYADIGEFLDEPVKTYSSGMQVRLAFAIAAHVEADIIIIDEALAVGDARFQLKCARTIDSLLEQGKTLLFVSHDPGSVKRLCKSALLLEQGECVMEGNPNTIINVYSKVTAGETSICILREFGETINVGINEVGDENNAISEKSGNDVVINTMKAEVLYKKKTNLGSVENNEIDNLKERLLSTQVSLAKLSFNKKLDDRIFKLVKSDNENQITYPLEFSYGGTLGVIEDIRLVDKFGLPTLVLCTGDEFSVSFKVTAKEKIAEPLYAITIKDTKGQDIYVTNTLYLGITPNPLNQGKSNLVNFKQIMNVMAGEYFISIGFVTFIKEELVVIHRRYDVIKIQVLPTDRCHGIANLYSDISINPID
jgi:ABC-type polysaccharide/polyol phosphate transport system ATPase subunit